MRRLILSSGKNIVLVGLLLIFGLISIAQAVSTDINCESSLLDRNEKIDCFIKQGQNAESDGHIKIAVQSYKKAESLCSDLSLRETAILLDIYSELLYLEASLLKYNNASSTAHKMLALATQLNDTFKMASSHNNLGWINYSLDNYARSIKHYKIAASLYKNKYPEEYAVSLLNLGTSYKDIQFSEEALLLFHEAIVTFEKLNSPKYLAASYNAIGNLHKNLKNYEQALNYHFKALDVRKSISNIRGVAGSYNNLGHVYKELEQYEKSLSFYFKALAIKDSIGNNLYRSSTLNSIGIVFLAQRKYDRAKEYLIEAYNIRSTSKSYMGALHSLSALTEIYLSQNKLDSALEALIKCQNLSIQIDDKSQLLKNVQLYGEYYLKVGDKDSVIEYLRKEHILKDTLFQLDKHRAMLELEARFNTEQQNKELKLLKEVELKQKEQLLLRKRLLYGTIVFSLLILILLFYSIRLFFIQKALRKKMELLGRDLHHRIKNNLQQLSSLFSLQLMTSKDNETKETLKTGKVRVLAMNLLHQQLYQQKDTSLLDVKVYLKNLSENVGDVYGIESLDKIMDFRIESIILEAEKATSIGLIFSELLCNVFKYVPKENLKIELKGYLNKGKLQFSIIDNGPGFNWKEKQNSSFGLKLVQLQVKQLKGKLNYSSKNGSRFEIEFPY